MCDQVHLDPAMRVVATVHRGNHMVYALARGGGLTGTNVIEVVHMQAGRGWSEHNVVATLRGTCLEASLTISNGNILIVSPCFEEERYARQHILLDLASLPRPIELTFTGTPETAVRVSADTLASHIVIIERLIDQEGLLRLTANSKLPIENVADTLSRRQLPVRSVLHLPGAVSAKVAPGRLSTMSLDITFSSGKHISDCSVLLPRSKEERIHIEVPKDGSSK